MTTDSAQDQAATRHEILRIAAVLFRERGYAKTKVMDIARAVGISAPSLYWHFASKEEILFEYLETNLEKFNETIDRVLQRAHGSEEKLRALAEAHTLVQLQFQEQAQDVLSMTYAASQLSTALSPERAGRIRELTRVHVDRTRAVIAEGVQRGIFATPDVTALTFAVLNICEYTTVWFRPDRELSAESVAAANGEFAVRMANPVTEKPRGGR